MHIWGERELLYDSDGKIIPQEVADCLTQALWDLIGEAMAFSRKTHEDNEGKSIPVADSLRDFVQKGAFLTLEDEAEREILLKLCETFGGFIGEAVSKQSLRFAWLEEMGDGTSFL